MPLAILPKFCYTNNEHLKGKIQIANYGKESLEGKTLCWYLVLPDKEKKKHTICGTGIITGNELTLPAGSGLFHG